MIGTRVEVFIPVTQNRPEQHITTGTVVRETERGCVTVRNDEGKEWSVGPEWVRVLA